LSYFVAVAMNAGKKAQEFNALRRRELARRHAVGTMRTKAFTLAAANKIRHQSLDVSRVDILEHEISGDN
jgi:hypothetical protein